MGKLAELFYNFNEISIVARLVLAAFCGGLIGIERERKRRAAGFRTHILTAMGAAMTTLVGQYLLTLEASSAENFVADPLRLGAQVISGMGFIGAGAIIVTRRKQVKGLTTAAGLWTTAIIGLAAGAGCYLEVIFSTVFIILAEMLFSKAEYYLMSNPRIVNVYVDFVDKSALYKINDRISEQKIEILDAEITKSSEDEGISVIFTLKFPRKAKHGEILNEIAHLESVRMVEEL
ncbi:MAG: MgtC/SapB family protein [Clostridia bacterium]|nr:MgtC/SapB family protein [Clostridia bacterium]